MKPATGPAPRPGARPPGAGYHHATVRSLRRALLALGVTGVIAAVLRLRGTGGVPPQTGGWRELSGPDLR
jgi:hypothetical protein